MKNKLVKYLWIITVLIGVLLLSNNYVKVKADSGWDSDYGSSSWDSGSDWGSSSDWSSSSHGSSGSGDFGGGSAILMSLFITIHYYGFVILPISAKLIKDNKEKQKKLSSKMLISRLVIVIVLDILFPLFAVIDFLLLFILAFSLTPFLTKNKYNKNYNKSFNYKQIDQETVDIVIPGFNIEEFNFKAYQIFYDVQMAWMNFDYDKLKELLTDELYNSYVMDLETLKVKNQRNTMNGFELINTKLIDLKEENNTYVAKVLVDVKFYDYIENINTNKVIRGTNSRKLNNTYILTFIKTKEETTKINKCPRCGAPVEGNTTGTCEYCKSKLANETYDWVMSKKEKISQR